MNTIMRTHLWRGELARARMLILQSLSAWQGRRLQARTQFDLAQLSDHTLRDIGMSRAEIGSFAAELYGYDSPTRLRVCISRDRGV